MGIGWCASIFSLEARLGEPALLSMGFLSPILGSTVQSLVYLEIVPSSPGRAMGFLMEALLLEMCTEGRVCVLMRWETVKKRLDRAFSRRCSCVCQNLEVKVQPWSSDLLAHSTEIQLFEGKNAKACLGLPLFTFTFSQNGQNILNFYLEDPYFKYSSCMDLEFRGWVALVLWVALDYYFENYHKFGQVISFRKIINCTQELCLWRFLLSSQRL